MEQNQDKNTMNEEELKDEELKDEEMDGVTGGWIETAKMIADSGIIGDLSRCKGPLWETIEVSDILWKPDGK